MDEQRFNKIMDFMADFRTSVEENIKKTNSNMEENMKEINTEMKGMKDRMDSTETDTNEVLRRMDNRLNLLEVEMRKTEERNKMRNKEQQKKSPTIMKSKTKSPRFSRTRIESQDLVKDVGRSSVAPTTYKSTWASGIEAELAQAARGGVSLEEKTEEEKEAPESWEELVVRKPVTVINWFGDDPESGVSSSESSESTAEDDESTGWRKVEKEKARKLKNIVRKQRRKEKMEAVALKIQHMVGLGPISEKSIKHFEEVSNDKDEALVKASKEFLQYYLDFNQEELEKIEIVEVKQAAKDEVIYIAVKDELDIKEIHYRKAKAMNNELIIRDYIPPSFHARYMAVAGQATVRRSDNPKLKTQLRWGDKDVEVFVKIKGSEETFKRINLKEFMGSTKLPDFDMNVNWKPRREARTRRELKFGQHGSGLPSLRNQESLQSLVRQHSNSSMRENTKRMRKEVSVNNSTLKDSEMEADSPLARK